MEKAIELRKRMNALHTEKINLRHASGLCRCGAKAEVGVKMCAKCLGRSREASRNAYRAKVGIPIDAPLSRRGKKAALVIRKKSKRQSSPAVVKGVTRNTNKDGFGREDTWYVAAVTIKGKALARKWSVTKHGETGAKLAASLQRLLWLVENGAWKPEHGDPLAIASYADSFSGNRDYDDCEISDVSSPWIQEYEDFT